MPSAVPQLDHYLQEALSMGATDLLIGGGEPPRYRVGGKFKRFGEVMDAETAARMFYDVLQPWQIERLEEEKQCDLSLDRIGGAHRFRVNIYFRRGGLGAAIRPIPLRIPTPDELEVPHKLLQLLERTSGMVMVTGRVGSGKSTICSCFLQHLNETTECHIVTMEDPIEYVFKPIKAAISQREMREHAPTFQDALKAVLRQSPDVIYVGELRDMETISATLTVAETGHLVLCNLHTANAPQTISRVVDVFPANQRPLISVQLANTLTAVVCQTLLPRIDQPGLIAAREIMFNNIAIANIVRKNELHQLYGQMEGSFNMGMKTMERSLAELYVAGKISLESARSHSVEPDALSRHIDRLLDAKKGAPVKR